MLNRSPWCKVLKAQTTSRAIELALELTPHTLSTAQLPIQFNDLSTHARNNVFAVRRALGVSVSGCTTTGWEEWFETKPDTRLSAGLCGRRPKANTTTEKPVTVQADDASPPRKKQRSVTSLEASADPSKSNDQYSAQSGSNPASKVQVKDDRISGLEEKVKTDAPPRPSPNELKQAQILRTWASTSPHTEPPREALQVVSRADAESVLGLLVPSQKASELLAPILRVLTDIVGTSFANHVMPLLVIPYAKTLTSPAPRDVMDSIVGFSKRHWRTAISLFEQFAQSNNTVNGATAEILVRVAAVLNEEGSYQGLSAFCRGSWGEDGIRVVESLLGRCKNHVNVGDILVPALQSNILGSEKSVRFGKLLFTTAKDIPDIASNHAEAIEAVCLRSKVFLAKRAVALLKNSNT